MAMVITLHPEPQKPKRQSPYTLSKFLKSFSYSGEFEIPITDVIAWIEENNLDVEKVMFNIETGVDDGYEWDCDSCVEPVVTIKATTVLDQEPEDCFKERMKQYLTKKEKYDEWYEKNKENIEATLKQEELYRKTKIRQQIKNLQNLLEEDQE